MNNSKIIRAIGGVDDDLIERAATKISVAQKNNIAWLKWAIPVAACLILTVSIIIPLFNKNENIDKDFNLVLSTGVTVSYIENPPDVFGNYSLVELTEKELFSDWLGAERVIFEGVIKKVDNIELSLSPGSLWYMAIAQIEVDVVYKGNIKQGEIITVLLQSPVGRSDVCVSDSRVSSQMTEGTRGIFMPTRYDESSVMSDGNENVIYWQEIADFGIGDGERHAFLDKPDGVVFARWAYQSIQDFEAIEGAPKMDEIRQYVIFMVEKYR